MVLINNLTIDEINAALIHLYRSRTEIVGGEKGDTVNNVYINNTYSGGGTSEGIDYSQVIANIRERLDSTDRNISSLENADANIESQIAQIIDQLGQMSEQGIYDLSFDEVTRELTITMQDGEEFTCELPSENVSLTFDSMTNKLVFTMGEQIEEVTLPYINASEKGVAGGVATLDGSGRVPYSQLPESAMEFKGEWDASTNTPTLADGTGTNGDFYIVSVGGTVNFGTQAEPRNITFYPNDRVIYNGTSEQWARLPAGSVISVNGLSGEVVLTASNINYDNNTTIKQKIDSMGQIQSNWTQTDTTKKDYIKNKIPIWITTGTASDNMQPVDSVTNGETRPVTSNAVADIMSSLPTDAVLHYSFDEVPDYPDGSADLLQIQFTSTTGWTAPSDITVSTENNSLKLVSTGSRQYVLVTNSAFSANTIKGKIVKVKVYSTDTIARCHIQEQNPSTYPEYQLTQISRSGNEYEFCGIMPSNMTYSSYLVIVFSNATSKTAYIKSIYVGNGSYTTPVIDNANGQNNGTNNGGIAVQGVSGKGAYFPSATQEMRIPVTNFSAPTSNDDFTISCWLKINSDYVNDTNGSTLKPIVSIGISSATGVVGLARRSNTIEYINRDSSNARTVETPMKKDGKWHNYIGVYDGTTHKSTLYEDGVLIGTSNANIANYQFGNGVTYWQVWSNTVITGVGSGTTTNQPATLDDLLIFNRALLQEEVTALYLNKANTPKYYSWADWKLSQM